MIQEKIAAGDLLYHAVHGLCRVDEVTKQSQSGKEALRYSLVPRTAHRMKSRFVIAASDMEISGFHTLVSPKEANKILDYLKAGHKKAAASAAIPETASPSAPRQNQAWSLARAIVSFSQDKFEARDQKKRQILERSAKGLVGELACVFKIPLKETAAMVQRSLGTTSKINPSVLTALAHTCED